MGNDVFFCFRFFALFLLARGVFNAVWNHYCRLEDRMHTAARAAHCKPRDQATEIYALSFITFHQQDTPSPY